MAERQYDIVRFGATGFTGGLSPDFKGQTPDGTRVVTEVSAGDPGDGETSKTLGEAARCLARDDRPQRVGQLTPAVAMGQALIDRRETGGITSGVVKTA
jgi:short subunit dehydrogenase-like uncharacterized protein